ncbi:hypothetical protein C1645_870075 [Glomus cerebriforme]|uniref:Crinkler (CRN) family protein n=1 Tax=Glomus cerebriforme TaxID=658196 RepID=A0A397TN32_9GLOM|nr:hypothetical protein C1645_870075 [Glomus cerebriforme]
MARIIVVRQWGHSGDEPISELKKAIKAEKAPEFDNFHVDRLKLWNIGDYWAKKPPKRHIHVLVEPPETTASSNEVLELRKQLASMQALLKKSVGCCITAFDVVVSPKRTKGFKWTVNIEHATLDSLKEYIHLREMLQLFVSKNNLKFTSFSDWTFSSVCQLYGLGGETKDPTMAMFPIFSCVISGPNGHGPLDFAIDLRQTAKTVGVTERKADEMEEDRTFGRVFGVVTDAEKFYFMEAQKPDDDSQSGEGPREIKRVRSTGDLSGKSDK